MNRNAFVFLTSLALASLTPVGQAQSSSGAIVGEALSGETILVTGVDTGFKREVKLDKDGKFQIRRVPTGSYQVVRVRTDGSIDPAQQVLVRPGGTAKVIAAQP